MQSYVTRQPIFHSCDADTLRHGLNFTFATDIGSLDLLGEVRGVGFYEDVVDGSITYELFGYLFPVIELNKLILAKRTAGRPKDLMAVAELEALREQQEKPADLTIDYASQLSIAVHARPLVYLPKESSTKPVVQLRGR